MRRKPNLCKTCRHADWRHMWSTLDDCLHKGCTCKKFVPKAVA